MIILSIETSCDETSIAVLQNRTVLSNVTITQVLEQKRFGGIVPNLAAKLHVTNIQKVLKEALLKSKKKKEEIDLVAYTAKPGLILCLQIGKIMAETIALYLNKEIISIDHLEGHIFSSLLDNSKA